MTGSTNAALWGARFKSAPDASLTTLSRSPEYYFSLAPYDLAGCRAHAHELERAGLLSADETVKMVAAIDQLDSDFREGRVAPSHADEDVHTFIERELLARLGALGGKLRAGRSRNDQTANDLRLYLRDNARKIVAQLLQLQQSLVSQAEQHTNTIAPGFTHLQQAQPIVFAHQLLAHAQAFSRDIQRMQDWDVRCGLSPLGAAAMAGSAIAMHPEHSAQELGYSAPCENSIDAVASRDHVAEFLFIAGMIGINLSRLGEEVCLWASRQFAWVDIHDSYATGSSIMPQKKNPDIAELTRGRSGRLLGNITAMMATMKGLPLSYNRDLSEDKRNALDSVDTLLVVLPAMSGMMATMTVDTDALLRQAPDGFTLATEVADWLAKRGVPFNEAHEITGKLVRFCEACDFGLSDVNDEQLREIDPRLTPDVRNALTLEAAIAARSGFGGTAPSRVEEQISRLKHTLATQSEWVSNYKGLVL
ncbi:argininosuccinate lyase [Pantoea agglomerans]|uniref:argininosuccinate lyase n=1 Tax=Pantoea TaxID=53335 RepID=UPI000BF0B4D9|nr:MULTISPECIES: argininosuccinate lyase [Pantoea]MDE8556225.1 argininosuccinate lyase [Pantoea vagans]MDE8576276.1 argininosuccinate lyase [Pantoea vagans]PEI04002.1 argininosuccinate lyase [Pantoea agglomerans]GME37336.1 argininosuccinate lyase [Pantoea sp. QMID3]GME38731.1 argininosuccinate lyase [Pantoea sp. QMID1]